MARASTPTIIPLDRVARHLGIDPWHFNGIETTSHPFNIPSCEDDWYQYEWQAAGKLSREALAFALRQAEDTIIDWLHWVPLPRYEEDTIEITPHFRNETSSLLNARGLPKSVTARYAKVIETGRKASSLIDTPAITYSDTTGDGFHDLATISFATTVTDTSELHVYYPSQSGRDEWEIRPLSSVTIAAGTATITFPKWLAGNISFQEAGAGSTAINGDTDTDFLTEVDVYRVYTDTTQQAVFTYDPLLDCSDPPCEADTETGCLFIRDARRGIIAYERADYDSDTSAFISKSFTKEPYKVTIYYRAGELDTRTEYPYSQMNQSLERMISFYALSLLDTELTGCANTSGIWNYMTEDLALSVSSPQGSKSFNILWNDLANPLGTSRAAMRLWKHIKNLQIIRTPNPR